MRDGRSGGSRFFPGSFARAFFLPPLRKAAAAGAVHTVPKTNSHSWLLYASFCDLRIICSPGLPLLNAVRSFSRGRAGCALSAALRGPGYRINFPRCKKRAFWGRSCRRTQFSRVPHNRPQKALPRSGDFKIPHPCFPVNGFLRSFLSTCG